MVVDKKKLLAELKRARGRERSERIEAAKRTAELEKAEKRREEVIEIRERDFNNGKSFRLLKKVIEDGGQKGVKCSHRLRRSLAENLRNPQHKDKYGAVADSLTWKNGMLRTTIQRDKITISYKEHKK